MRTKMGEIGQKLLREMRGLDKKGRRREEEDNIMKSFKGNFVQNE